jgi:L-lysine 2,3-aminomutase
MQQIQARLPGYAVPRYVQETAGAPSKVPLFSAEATT